MTLKANAVRPFLPAKDFALSKDFYTALGWTITWSDEKLAVMDNGGHHLYLQDYYVKEWADNTMLHISVDDVQASYAHISAVIDGGRFPGTRISEPKHEAYGALVSYVWDPSGVLLHLAQWD